MYGRAVAVVLAPALLALLLAVLASVHAAAQTTPLEPCFTNVVEAIPPSPEPGDVIRLRVTNCQSQLDVAVYWYPASGGYELVAAFTQTEYIYEFYVGPFNEPGCLEVWLDGQVAKRIPVGVAECSQEAPAPDPPEVTTTTTEALVDLSEVDYRKLAVLAGAGAVAIVGLAMALARRG